MAGVLYRAGALAFFLVIHGIHRCGTRYGGDILRRCGLLARRSRPSVERPSLAGIFFGADGRQVVYAATRDFLLNGVAHEGQRVGHTAFAVQLHGLGAGADACERQDGGMHTLFNWVVSDNHFFAARRLSTGDGRDVRGEICTARYGDGYISGQVITDDGDGIGGLAVGGRHIVRHHGWMVRQDDRCRSARTVAHIGDESLLKRAEHIVSAERIRRAHAPEILHQIGIVHEGVSVALRSFDTVVAVNLFLRHRVLPVPFDEQRLAVFR